MEKFKVIVAGGRDFKNYNLLSESLYTLLNNKKPSEVEIVSGNCRGADMLGERWSRRTATSLKKFPADWDKYGKSAGYKRNLEMAEYADALVAFWDGKSKGTSNMIRLAKLKGIKVRVVMY